MATYPIRQLADNGGTAQFVPVTAPEAVQFPDGSNLNTFIGSVATIESNPVSANHAVGEFLCINSQVYEVIDAITAGDAIALGENVQVTNLGSQITALNNGLTPATLSLSSRYTMTNTSFRMGKLIAISFKVAGLNGSSDIIVATIQQGYEPDIEVPIVANTNNGVYVTGWIRPSSGDIVIAPRSALSSTEVRVLAVYHI